MAIRLEKIMPTTEQRDPQKAPPSGDKKDTRPTTGELLSSTQRADLHERYHRWGQDIATLLDAVSVISSLLEVKEVAEMGANYMTRFLRADICILSLWNPTTKKTQYLAGFSKQARELDEDWRQSFDLGELPLTIEVAESLFPQQVQVDTPKANSADRKALQLSKAQALVLLPLFAQNEIIGFIEVYDQNKARTFSDEEIALGQLFAHHVGSAIERAKLLKESKQRAAELEALRQASLSLTTHLDLQDVLGAILKSTLDLLEDAQNAHIFLYQNGALKFNAALWTDGRDEPISTEPRLDGLTYAVAKRGESIIVQDMRADSLYARAPAEWQGSIVGMPLKIRDRVVGVMNVSQLKTHAFSENDLHLLHLLGDQAAIAIENARLHKAVEKRATELEALRQASLGLTTTLDSQDVLKAILKSTLSLLEGIKDAHIFIFKEDTLSFGAALFANDQEGISWAEPRPDGLTYTVAKHGDAIVVQNMRIHPLFADTPSDWEGSIVGLPLKIGNRVVGVMNVAHQESNAFTESDLRLLRLLGDQAAIAIANARLHDLVKHQARTDPLTGLANRRALDQRLDIEMRRASRYQRTFSVIMMDLDGFKRVNDTYGHPAGDQTLKLIAQCLQKVVRDTDFLARYGGDEFALLLPETDHTVAQQVGEKLKKALNKCPSEHIKELNLSMSIGIASFPQDAASVEDLIANADQCLYLAKDKADQVRGN